MPLRRLLDSPDDDTYPPKHLRYWSVSDSYLMGNVTPGDMRAIIQTHEEGSPGGGAACVDLINRLWDCRTKRRITCKQVLQHPWITQCSPPANPREIEDELRDFLAGKFRPDESSLLGQLFYLKPGTDRVLLEEHRIG